MTFGPVIPMLGSIQSNRELTVEPGGKVDTTIKRELDKLLHDFTLALDEVRFSDLDSDQQLAAWHRVQVCGWRLNQLLPSTGREVA